MGVWMISVGFKAPTKPSHRFNIQVVRQFGQADEQHPQMKVRIPRRETHCCMEMRFSFRDKPREKFSETDACVGVGQISVQRNSTLTVGNALRRAACKHLNK